LLQWLRARGFVETFLDFDKHGGIAPRTVASTIDAMMRQAKNAQRSAIPNGAKPPIGLDTTALPWRLPANGRGCMGCRDGCKWSP
jgi:hypothetical protein